LASLVYWVHQLLFGVYYLYAQSNASDSGAYFRKVVQNYRGDNWEAFYGTSTTFIEFIGYPFIKYFGFNYESMMILFSFFGLLGFLFFIKVVEDKIKFTHYIWGVNFIFLIFLFPNLHFWTVSFGKGSLIFFGLGLFFYGLSKYSQRIIALIIGGVVVYHIRPHIFFVMLISFIISATLEGKLNFVRVTMLIGSSFLFFMLLGDVQTLTGIEDIESFSTLDTRAESLLRATSGVDLSKYNQVEKLLTFWFRPLFFDAPGFLGIITSIENLFNILILIKIIKWDFIKRIFQGDSFQKTMFLTFIFVSIAIAQISGNLGLALRQKSQIWLLLFMTILIYLDQIKMSRFKEYQFFQWKRNKLNQLAKNIKPKLINQKGKI